MSTNIKRHYYTYYDGKPYIYHYGIPFVRENERTFCTDHPYRSIVRYSVDNDKKLEELRQENVVLQLAKLRQNLFNYN